MTDEIFVERDDIFSVVMDSVGSAHNST